MVDAKSVEKATSKIVDVLKSDMNQLFDHVLETVKEGTKIIFTMAENGKKVVIEIADLIKNKISDAAIGMFKNRNGNERSSRGNA